MRLILGDATIERKTRPYGTWDSPLSAARIAEGSVRFGFPSMDAAGALYFVESRPAEGGRSVLVRRTPKGEFEELTKAPFSVRSRVHEYGGLAHVVGGSSVFFVHAADQQIYVRTRNNEEPRRLTSTPEVRYAEPVFDAERARLIAVAERHASGASEPSNELVSVDVGTGAVESLASGRCFYAAPALSPDGTKLAFLTWDHPHMPWEAAEVWLLELSPEGRPGRLAQVAGGPSGAAFQPTWSPDGVLYFSLEAGEYSTLHRFTEGTREEGTVEQVVALEGELSLPLWQLGTRSFTFVTETEILALTIRRGRPVLTRIDTRARSECPLEASPGNDFGPIGHVVSNGERCCLLSGSAGSAVALVTFDVACRVAAVVKDAHAGWLDVEDTSEAEDISFETAGGERAHGVFYAPKNRQFSAPRDTLPPLVVMAHGGPTGRAALAFNPVIQFFTTRGFAVLDVNYRGSTGYGRSYRERLRGSWGIVDVEDCVFGARRLAEQGRVDGRRLVIRGGSAGGYTVLQALANHRVFAAGACHYGVSDLEALMRDTHKFESRYDRFLIGEHPAERARYVERSPIYYPERIDRPVVFFQGALDKVVPAAQTRLMAESLRAHGVETEYHEYPDEYHGFRSAENQRHALETELAFFRRVLAL